MEEELFMPSCDVLESQELFPDLVNLVRQIENNQALSVTYDDECPSPEVLSDEYINSDSDSYEGDDNSVDVESNPKDLKRYHTRSQQFPSSLPKKLKKNPPEVVVVVPNEQGKEQEYRGPNRNAIMAKLNRERKKKQMQVLEKTVEHLSKENKTLRAERGKLSQRVEHLEGELEYLKGVLANQSELACLLQNIQATSLTINSSLPLNDSVGDFANRSVKKVLPVCKITGKKQNVHFLKKETKASQKKVQIKNPICLEKIVSRPRVRSVKMQDDCDHQYASVTSDYNRTTTGEKLGKGLRENVSVRIPPKSEAAGVCLHVCNSHVSLEFCSKCSQRAKAAADMRNVKEENVDVKGE